MLDNRRVHPLNGYLIAVLISAVYAIILLIGRRLKLWDRLGIKLFGPVMMLRTSRGRAFIARLGSRTRAWNAYGLMSVIISVFMTAVITGFLIWEVYTTYRAQNFMDLSGELPFGQTHIDSAVTAVYVVVGISVAVLAHELCHGILSFVSGIKLRSIGVLLLVVPIGAFVEPDDEELKTAARSKRLKVFAAGPAANALVATIFIVILLGVLMPSVRPVADGPVVVAVAPNSPADISGIRGWSALTELNGEPMSTSSFRSVSFAMPGELVSVNLTYKHHRQVLALPGGVVVSSVSDGPALNAGVESGMIIARLNGTVIHSVAELQSVVENSTRNSPVNITVLRFGHDTTGGINWFVEDNSIRSVNLTSKWLYYRLHFPSLNREEYRNVSYIGVTSSPLGIEVADPRTVLGPVTHPLGRAGGPDARMRDFLRYLGLPFFGYAPLVSPEADLYEPSGIMSAMPPDVFWAVSNLCYWIFWANLMLALTNALPAVPMDGGMVMSDLLKGLAKRLGERLSGLDLIIGKKAISERQVDRFMVALAVTMVIVVAYLVLWQAFG